MKTYILASGNKGKLAEFRELLKDDEVLTMKEIGFTEEIIEDGNSFEENALIKARAIQEFLKKSWKVWIVLADDSGLCVESLNGAPWIYSWRYAGPEEDSSKNRKKLLAALQNIEKRNAYFICCLVEYFPDDTYKVFEGKTFWTILKEEKGENGFWYDSLFLSDDLGKTFAEATPEEKNAVSHRGRAIQKFLESL